MHSGKRNAARGRSASRGFTFIALLVGLLMLSLATHAVVIVLAAQSQRAKLAEQKAILAAYASAISSYYTASPGTRKQYPETIDDLLLDKRQLGTQRHLRKPYTDPLQVQQGSDQWGFERDVQGHITAVYSLVTNPVP